MDMNTSPDSSPWRDSTLYRDNDDEKEMALMISDAKINIQHILFIGSWLILIEFILVASLSPLTSSDKWIVFGFLYAFCLYIITYAIILLMNLFQPFFRLDAEENDSPENEKRLIKLRKLLIENIRLVFDFALFGAFILGSTLFVLLNSIFLLYSHANGISISISIVSGLWLLYLVLCKTKFDIEIFLFLFTVISVSVLSLMGQYQNNGIMRIAWSIPVLCFLAFLLVNVTILLVTEKANGVPIKLKVYQKESAILYLLGFALLLFANVLYMCVSLTYAEYSLIDLPSLSYNLIVISIGISMILILFGINIVIEEFLNTQLKTKGGKRPLALKQHANKGYVIDKETSHVDHFLLGEIFPENMESDASKSRILSLVTDFFSEDEMCSCCKVLNCAMCCSTEMTSLEGNQHEA